jgi:DHA1 family inner membrane transport protein
MNPRIPVLALASFAMGTEAHVYAGHLESLARDVGQPVAAAGQLATAFALTYALTAPVVAGLVARFDRRTMILIGLVLVGILNIAASVAPSMPSLLAIRVACGLAAGLVGPISSLAAAELAPPAERGKAMAVVLAGMTVAFVLGIPVGSVIGDVAGWRGTFVYAGAVALLAGVFVRFALPPVPGGRRADLAAFRVALRPEVRGPLLLSMAGFAATFTIVAYVGPVVTAISGLTGSGVGAMQALIGVGSILGVVLGARFADRPATARLLTASFVVSAFALLAYTLLMARPEAAVLAPLISGPRAGIIAALSLAMVAGAAALFTRTPVIQASLVRVAPHDARGIVLALNGSMMFVGQGLGAALGGLTLAVSGIEWLGLAASGVALLGAGLASRQASQREAPAAAAPLALPAE